MSIELTKQELETIIRWSTSRVETIIDYADSNGLKVDIDDEDDWSELSERWTACYGRAEWEERIADEAEGLGQSIAARVAIADKPDADLFSVELTAEELERLQMAMQSETETYSSWADDVDHEPGHEDVIGLAICESINSKLDDCKR